jgi:dTDP-4-dehydrorhamnose reductase
MTGSLLIFGAAGQVGQEVVNSARKGAVPVFGASRNDADITDEEAVARLVDQQRPSLIVNAAAYTAVDKAESEPELAYWINAHGAETVARVAARSEVPLLHISTDYVFDGTKAGRYTEEDPISPACVYGCSKAEGEKRVRTAYPRSIIVRTAWVYGFYGSNFLKTILALANTREHLRVVSDQKGCPTATADIAGAILAVAKQKDIAARGGLFHFAGSGIATWHDFAEAIVDVQTRWTGKRPRVDKITTDLYPTPAERPKNSSLDSTHFELTFSYRAKPWRARVTEVIDRMMRTAR